MKISSLLTNAGIATGLAAAAIISAPLTASAASFSYNFGNIFKSDGTPSDAVGDALATSGQLNFTVSDDVSGKTKLQIFNSNISGSVTSFINEIYFDWTTPLTFTSQSGAGVNYDLTGSVSPGNLPQNGDVNGGFNSNKAIEPFSEGANQGGIDVGQSLTLLFTGQNATQFNTDILNSSLRIGIHVKGIGNSGGSDAFVNCPSGDGGRGCTPPSTTPVPVPGFLLGVMAAGALGGSRLLKNKKQVA